MSRPVLLVIGAGPGVSGSVARRFGREGYATILVGLDLGILDALARDLGAEDVEAEIYAVDVTDTEAFRSALATIGERSGQIDVVHFNPSAFRQKSPLELSPKELAEDLALGVGALLTAVQGARPFMAAGGRVTATGSMAADNPWNEAASLGVQKAGMRNLIHSIDATLREDGIRAVSLTVQGALASEGAFTPDKVAAAIWKAAHQAESGWLTELSYTGGGHD